MLEGLRERGLRIDEDSCVSSMGEGLRKAVYDVFGSRALVQRCQWHKRENVLSYLPKGMQGAMRRRLQEAYEEPSYEKAKEKLLKIRRELEQINRSAVSSLDEGFEETLTLQAVRVVWGVGDQL